MNQDERQLTTAPATDACRQPRYLLVIDRQTGGFASPPRGGFALNYAGSKASGFPECNCRRTPRDLVPAVLTYFLILAPAYVVRQRICRPGDRPYASWPA